MFTAAVCIRHQCLIAELKYIMLFTFYIYMSFFIIISIRTWIKINSFPIKKNKGISKKHKKYQPNFQGFGTEKNSKKSKNFFLDYFLS